MKHRFTIALAVLPLLVAFSDTASADPLSADLIVHNGRVITVDDRFSIRSAVVVKDGKILAVGDESLAARYRAPDVIDLHGRTLMPGLIDTHMHLYGTSSRQIDSGHAHSIVELQSMLRAKAKELGPGKWITGIDWDEYVLAERRKPLRGDLDAAAPDNPVALTRAGGHSIVGSSRALSLAGIDRRTQDPDGGIIEHDAAGEPNGIIRERSDLYSRVIPLEDPVEMIPLYAQSLKAELALGVTTIFEASTRIDDEPLDAGGTTEKPKWESITYRELRTIYQQMAPQLPRAIVLIDYPGAARLEAFGKRTGYGDDHLRLGPIGETGYDGGFTGPTALTTQDYKGLPGFRGKTFFSRADLQEMVETSARLGWQIGIHAIGDAAIIQVVDAFDQALKKYPRHDHRWFLAHFTMMPPVSTMQTMSRDGIYAEAQPNFLYNLEGRYVETLDGERLRHINPVATPLKYGVKVVFGSDNLPLNPWVALYAAITRKGSSGTVYGPEEAVSRQSAIRMYTRTAAELSWDEKKKGSLERGKYADMIILPKDPLSMPAEDFLTLKVETTIVGGRIVYQRNLDTAQTPMASVEASKQHGVQN